MRDLSGQAKGQAEGPEALALLACGVTLGSGFRNQPDYLSERAWEIKIVPLFILVPRIYMPYIYTKGYM